MLTGVLTESADLQCADHCPGDKRTPKDPLLNWQCAVNAIRKSLQPAVTISSHSQSVMTRVHR